MGIGKLSWKKVRKYLWKIILGFIALVGFITGIIGIATNWDKVSNWLGSIGNFLADPIVRDVFLLVLIGILLWLFLRKRKARSIPHQTSRHRGLEDWQYDWNLKHEFVLVKIAERKRSYGSAYKLYERKFSNTSKLDFRVIMEDLEEVELIRLSFRILGIKYYEATRKGRDYASKGLLAEMENERIASEF